MPWFAYGLGSQWLLAVVSDLGLIDETSYRTGHWVLFASIFPVAALLKRRFLAKEKRANDERALRRTARVSDSGRPEAPPEG